MESFFGHHAWRDMHGAFQVAGLALMIRATRGRSRRPNHMPSHLDGLQTMSSVNLRRFAGNFHSVAKQASSKPPFFRVPGRFWSDFGRFRRLKWRSKSILKRYFSDVFFNCVSASFLDRFLEGRTSKNQ